MIDQIAAGEVVERPASVVKELVENAIDAGAHNIEVRLQEGGMRRIEVRDDGLGIAAADLPLALTSHATSKLRQVGDLEAIASLGFRGEALASIASVSRLELVSWPAGQQDAASLRSDYGHLGEVQAAAGARGTRLVVEDLFAQTPARLKFLKRPATELAHCAAWVERLALSHVGVGFRVEHQGRCLLEVAADADLAARCAAVYGAGLADNMVAIEHRNSGVQLQARVGPPESARRDARRVNVFLNGRWVRDPRLLRAVREGVREFVPLGHYPTLYLALSVAPDRVDVNVHPQKTEVRFRDERLIFGSVVRGLQEGLSRAQWATRAAGPVGSPPPRWRPGSRVSPPQSSLPPGLGAGDTRGAPGSGGWRDPAPPSVVGEGGQAEAVSLPLDTPAGSGGGRVLSVAKTYLVREVEGGLEILDQHALHERVNLEELRQEIRQGQVVTQPLLVPVLVEVGRVELALLLDKADTLRALGVEVEAFGDHTLAIRSVPARLTRLVPEKLLDDLLEIAREQRAASPEKLAEEMLYSMACRGAVMAGDRLQEEDLQGLLRRGAHLPQDRTCAHGRPVRVFLSLEDLEKAFYRRV